MHFPQQGIRNYLKLDFLIEQMFYCNILNHQGARQDCRARLPESWLSCVSSISGAGGTPTLQENMTKSGMGILPVLACNPLKANYPLANN